MQRRQQHLKLLPKKKSPPKLELNAEGEVEQKPEPIKITPFLRVQVDVGVIRAALKAGNFSIEHYAGMKDNRPFWGVQVPQPQPKDKTVQVLVAFHIDEHIDVLTLKQEHVHKMTPALLSEQDYGIWMKRLTTART